MPEVICVDAGSTVAAKAGADAPGAAFPYVFAAEGAQHPPNKPPRSTTRRNKPAAINPPQQTRSKTRRDNPPQRARFGKEEENLHFCRRKCKIKKERPTSPST